MRTGPSSGLRTNWGFNSAYGGEASTANFVNNYYKSGSATKSGVKSRIYQPSDTLGKWYIAGNYVAGNSTVTNDNWAGGVNPSIAPTDINTIKATSPYPFEPVTTQTPAEAFDLVLQYAGATAPKRDTVDRRIVMETQTGTVTYGGRTYAIARGFDTTKVYGIIDSQDDVGGWPVLNSVDAPTDTDHDGMPDDWETANLLNPNDANDRNTIGQDGYTMLEKYINGLVGSNPSTTTDVQDKLNSIPGQFSLSQNYPNPFNPTTVISYQLPVSSFVHLGVFDLLGREVALLVDGDLAAGTHTVEFNASALPSGVYLYRLRTPDFVAAKKMVLVK